VAYDKYQGLTRSTSSIKLDIESKIYDKYQGLGIEGPETQT